MGLIVKPKAKEQEVSILVTDETGNATFQYPYGYGPQTVLKQWVTGAKIFVVTPLSTSEYEIDVTFDPLVIENEWQIMPWDIVSSWQKVPSGLYTIRLELTGTTALGVDFKCPGTTQIVCTKAVECCIDQMVTKTKNVAFNDVFRDEQSRKAAEMSALLERALYWCDCGDMVSAGEAITYLRLNCRCNC